MVIRTITFIKIIGHHVANTVLNSFPLIFARTHTETEAQRGDKPAPSHTANNGRAELGPRQPFSELPTYPSLYIWFLLVAPAVSAKERPRS